MNSDNLKIKNEIERYVRDMSFIIKKTHRVSIALTIVSKCLLDHDPFKNKLRGIASELVSHTATFHKKGSLDKEIAFDNIEDQLLLAETYLFTLWSVGEISEKNYSLVSGAIRFIVAELKKNTSPYGEKTTSFGGAGTGGRALVDESWMSEFGGGKSDTTPSPEVKMSDRKQSSDKGVSYTPSIKTEPHSTSNEKTQRINKIMSFIKDKGEVGIKDIMSLIPDVAGKTLQRDLQYLIDNSQIRREGDKRWTRYMSLR